MEERVNYDINAMLKRKEKEPDLEQPKAQPVPEPVKPPVSFSPPRRTPTPPSPVQRSPPRRTPTPPSPPREPSPRSPSPRRRTPPSPPRSPTPPESSYKDYSREELKSETELNEPGPCKHQRVGQSARDCEICHPRGGKDNYMHVGISGQIETGSFKSYDGLAIKYGFVAGDRWIKEKGIDTGISQHSFKSKSIQKRVVWNFPFEVTFKSKTLLGWPQIVIYCSCKDFAGREVVVAYGATHVPTHPGRHLKTVKMFKPVCSSILTRLAGWLRGKAVEYHDAPGMIAKAEGRSLTRVIPNGIIKVNFQITSKNFKEKGYISGSKK